MYKRMFILLACLLAWLPALSACSMAGKDLMAEVRAADWPDAPSQLPAAFRESVRDFSWQLMQRTVSDQGNILISPASVYLALAMTSNGAGGESKTGMQKALFAEDLTLEQLNQGCRDWISLLKERDEDSQLAVANSIWLDHSFAIDQDFLQTNADYFAAAARALAFDQPSAQDEINNWVRQNTGGKIKKIIDEIDPEAVMFLINAVYFKSNWKLPFASSQTRPGLFNTPAGPTDVQYMKQQASFAYVQAHDCQSVLLPYSSDRFAFLAILPDEGIQARDWVKEKSARDLDDLLERSRPRSLDLSLPKFTCSYTRTLNDILAELGMADAFDPYQADFSLLDKNRGKNFYIDAIRHKTYCALDEKGTEAAAVTSVGIKAVSMPQAELSLVFDRPFIFAIMDRQSYLTVFLGLMEDPAAG